MVTNILHIQRFGRHLRQITSSPSILLLIASLLWNPESLSALYKLFAYSFICLRYRILSSVLNIMEAKCKDTTPASANSSNTWVLVCHCTLLPRPLSKRPCHGRLSIPRYPCLATDIPSQYSPNPYMLDPKCCKCTDVHWPLCPPNNTLIGYVSY